MRCFSFLNKSLDIILNIYRNVARIVQVLLNNLHSDSPVVYILPHLFSFSAFFSKLLKSKLETSCPFYSQILQCMFPKNVTTAVIKIKKFYIDTKVLSNRQFIFKIFPIYTVMSFIYV